MSGNNYIPDPTDASQPTGSQLAKTAAAEFRALKAYINGFRQSAPTWNPADKAADITLSAGNLLPIIFTPFISVAKGVRATTGKTGSSVFYFEHLMGTTNGRTQVGLSILNTSMDNGSIGVDLGGSIDNMAYSSEGYIRYNNVVLVIGAPLIFGDVVGISFNADDSVQFYHNGVAQGTAIFWHPSISTYTKYPVAALAATNDYIVTNFGATNFLYPIPTGNLPFYDPTNSPPTGPQNLICNSDMLLDQRNARAVQGAIAGGSYMSDRWRYDSNIAGALNAQSLVCNTADQLATQGCYAYQRMSIAATTVPGAASYSVLQQLIEGIRIGRLLWGSVNAHPVTVSFWWRSSVANKFTMGLQNSAKTRSFLAIFETTIPLINVWTRFSAVIPGCVDGVWDITTGIGLQFTISMGTGVNGQGPASGTWNNADDHQATGAGDFMNHVVGAAFDITGVEIKPGYYSASSPREVINPSIEALDCERYFIKKRIYNAGYTNAGVTEAQHLSLPASMRVVPTGAISADANTNCAGSTFVALTGDVVSIRTVGAALGGFIQDCIVDINAELP